MKVKDLIERLGQFDTELPVAYPMWSEQLLLEPEDLEVKDLCLPRPDGWIQNKRPDMPTQQYLVIG